MSADQPWLNHKAWGNNNIASDARRAHWVMWGFALFWNLVTLPLFIQFKEIWQKVQREPLTALVFLFPLLGLMLAGLAIGATRQKRRFGHTPLVMDPFPGSLGGQVGGFIDTAIPYDPQRKFAVSRGVFGVPSMLVGEELFFGYDDFSLLTLYLQGADPVDRSEMDCWSQSRMVPSADRRKT